MPASARPRAVTMLPPAPSRLGLLLRFSCVRRTSADCGARRKGMKRPKRLALPDVGVMDEKCAAREEKHWAVGSPLVMDPTSICRKARRLAGRQAELCQAEPEVVAELARGARLGVRECQFQFRFRRWNCSSHSKAFGRILQQDIRETAFVFAITAAGASHAVTQACSMGELLQCGCQAPRGRAPPRPPGLPGTPGPPGPAGSPDGSAAWEWGGCGDDVDFGDEKSRLFMDAQHKRGRGDIRALVQLHNNEAGRLAVRSHTRTECKCHGLSGSCALRTCWQKLPPFREVGARLLERFHGASRVMGTNDGKALLPAVRTLKPPGRADLLYAADSPDFCAPNRRTGSPGTRGRACNSSAPDLSGCDLLCCGRGHRQESVQLEENCLCRFHWCCVVQCHRCRVRKELSLCL
ncbi:Protein Wnt-6 [Camelus dromedarius]|uniref:Protein Wnt n=3 Tax=Artiodactyla TaxID=91561 RepID=A0A5N4E6H2_CAMDR|nr:Protein Wnt-6 [Camelus dromedarius]